MFARIRRFLIELLASDDILVIANCYIEFKGAIAVSSNATTQVGTICNNNFHGVRPNEEFEKRHIAISICAPDWNLALAESLSPVKVIEGNFTL